MKTQDGSRQRVGKKTQMGASQCSFSVYSCETTRLVEQWLVYSHDVCTGPTTAWRLILTL